MALAVGNWLNHAEIFPLCENTLIARFREEAFGGQASPADGFPEVTRVLLALAAKIGEESPPGLVEVVPARQSLAVIYDPFRAGFDEWRGRMEGWIGGLSVAPDGGGRLVEIPVSFGGSFGPDLEEVARATGLGADETVRLFCGAEFVVGMIGFAPGFPYLLGLPERLALPRRAVPRTKVPAGSVAIGGGQAGIYPADLPGGWHIIGRTPLSLFDPAASPPSLLAPGDRVRFVPADESAYRELCSNRTMFPASRADSRDGAGASGAGIDSAGQVAEAGEFGATPELPELAVDGQTVRTGERPITGFRVLKPGLYTTVQDMGRPGLERYGVTPGGAMDTASFRLANRLVGNRAGEPALEITMSGPELEVLEDTVIAVCGAHPVATVNGIPLPAGRPVAVKRGDLLKFGPVRRGCRAYLAVAGGFDVPRVMGGCGAYPAAGLPGLSGRALIAGDELFLRVKQVRCEPVRWSVRPPHLLPAAGDALIVRVMPGPEFGRLSPEMADRLMGQSYSVLPQSNRMGLRLSGEERIVAADADMVSETVARGTVQLPPGGEPIVLAADRQTTGGYPRVLQVIAADLPLLGQAAPGMRLVFRRVDLGEALAALAESERQIRMLERFADLKLAEGRG